MDWWLPLVLTVENVNDDRRWVDIVRNARIVARVYTLSPFDDERAGRSVADDFDAGRSFIVDHPFVLVPEDKVGRHATLPQMTR